MKKFLILIASLLPGLLHIACVSSPERKQDEKIQDKKKHQDGGLVQDKKPAGPVCGDGKIE